MHIFLSGGCQDIHKVPSTVSNSKPVNRKCHGNIIVVAALVLFILFCFSSFYFQGPVSAGMSDGEGLLLESLSDDDRISIFKTLKC